MESWVAAETTLDQTRSTPWTPLRCILPRFVAFLYALMGTASRYAFKVFISNHGCIMCTAGFFRQACLEWQSEYLECATGDCTCSCRASQEQGQRTLDSAPAPRAQECVHGRCRIMDSKEVKDKRHGLTTHGSVSSLLTRIIHGFGFGGPL